MKHTQSISLVLIASMTAITLTACSKPQPSLEGQKIFSTIEECEKFGTKDCKQHYDRAAFSHLLKAPRYPSTANCKTAGHQECSEVTLDGATVWLPKMVGFMANSRPVYLQGYDQKTAEYEDEDGYINERPLTADELKERAVVAGPSVFDNQDDDYDRTSVVVLGGWYPTPYYYSYGFSGIRSNSLTEGMRTSYIRANPSSGRTLALSSNYVPSARSASIRGSVGGYGRSSFTSSRSASARSGFGGGGRGFGSGS